MSARSPRAGVTGALTAAAAMAGLGLGPAPARAEVWPAPPASLVAGPFAVIEPGPLALWTNPALAAALPGWQVGASYAEPFGISELARSEVAAAWRPSGLAVCAGAARHGAADLAAPAWGAGLAGRVAGEALLAGLAARLHRRGERQGWALDLGVRARPAARLTVGAVARSAVRAGEPQAAPEPEWELGAVWQDGALAVAAGLSRDAVGPLWSGIGTRFDAGALSFYTALGRLAGGEARLGVGVRLRLAGRVTVAVGQETGPLLPESRAAVVEFVPGRERGERGAQRAGAPGSGGEAQPPGGSEAPPPSGREAPPPAPPAIPPQADPGPDLDSLIAADARRRELERAFDAAQEPVAADGAAPLGADLEPGSARPPGRGVPRAPATSAPSWRSSATLTLGAQPWRAASLGLSAAAEVSLWPGHERPRANRSPRAVLRGAATRDPGEPGGFDEARADLAVGGAWGRAVIGSFDAALAGGLVAVAPSPQPADSPLGSGAWRIGPAARAGRAGVPALWGAAAQARLSRTWALAALWGHGRGDARLTGDGLLPGGGLWPTGGRLHRTALERERRGALAQEVAAAALEWAPSRAGRARAASAPELRLGLVLAAAAYHGAAPRLVRGGSLLYAGRWAAAITRLTTPALLGTAAAALGPGGRGAQELDLTWRRAGRGGSSARLSWEHRADGYARAVADPALAPHARLQVRWTASPAAAAARSSAWLGLGFEEWVGSPGSDSPGRRTWTREGVAGAAVRPGAAAVSLELGHAATWREAQSTAGGAGPAGPAPMPAPWRVTTHATWRPAGSHSVLSLGHSRRRSAGPWLETWELGWAGPLGAGREGRVAVEIRPGTIADGGSDLGFEADPLGGTRYWTSRAPGRATAELRFARPRRGRAGGGPAGGADAGWSGRLLARCFTASEQPRFELWLTVTRGTPAPP